MIGCFAATLYLDVTVARGAFFLMANFVEDICEFAPNARCVGPQLKYSPQKGRRVLKLPPLLLQLG
jgi:hypothetical protein